jgi:hypothetical protein
MLSQLSRAERLTPIAEYLYVPYQGLQIAGYRLAGKRCAWQWRKYRPEPIGPTRRVQHLVAGLFPAAALILIAALQFVLSLYLFFQFYPQAPWIIIPAAIQPAIPFSLYAYLIIFDVLRLRRLWSGPEQAAQGHHN